MYLSNEVCDKLCVAALQKSTEMGFDISFAVYDEKWLATSFPQIW